MRDDDSSAINGMDGIGEGGAIGAGPAPGELPPQVEALRSALERAQAEARQAHTEAARARVAARWRLPEPLARRLRGETEAELEADARELARILPRPASAANPAGDPGLTLDDVRHMTPEQINRRWSEVQRALRGE